VPYKFELGGPAHEGCAGIVALTHYLNHMAAPSSSSSGETHQLQVSSCCAYNLNVNAGSLQVYGDMTKRICGCVAVGIDRVTMFTHEWLQPHSLINLAAGITAWCMTAWMLCIQAQVVKWLL